MGKHSDLWAYRPTVFWWDPGPGVVEELQRAYTEIKADQLKAAVWQPIIAKYQPTLIGECEKAIQWANEMVREWLLSGMLAGKENAEQTATTILNELGDHALTKSHARHLSIGRWKKWVLRLYHLKMILRYKMQSYLCILPAFILSQQRGRTR